jgi:prepilin-type N-terminal cleavage/methylation domain-containing protein
LNCDKDMIQRNGMTLIELLVVLAILALMTTVAVTSSDVFMSQGRYDATSRTLTDIQEAVLGPANARQADGTLMPTGFVADMGRLPFCTSTGLSELWTPSSPTLSWTLQSSTDPDVVITCGWRGPYLRLAPGQTGLTPICDGWGNLLNLLTTPVPNPTNLPGTPAALNAPISFISSNGAGGTGPYSASNAPLAVSLVPPQIAVSGYVYVLSNGNPVNPGAGTQIQVWMYCPNVTTGLLWELQCTVTTATDGSGVVSYGPPYLPSGASPVVTSVCAPGFVRAYVGGSRAAATQWSPVVQFQRSGSINLNIQ